VEPLTPEEAATEIENPRRSLESIEAVTTTRRRPERRAIQLEERFCPISNHLTERVGQLEKRDERD
jgi:hypothetical protein